MTRFSFRPAAFDLSSLLALALLVIGLFYPVGNFKFLNYDDPGHVTASDTARNGLDIGRAFTSTETNLWHPLTWVSHQLDVQISGFDAGSHHLVNLGLHLANTLLLFLFLRLSTGKIGASLAVAALFAVHPLHIESAAWISERKGLLCAFFWLLGLLAYDRYRKSPGPAGYLCVSGALVAALLAKPVAVTFPLVLLLLDLWPCSRLDPAKLRHWRDPEARALLREKIPWLIIAVLFAIVTVLVQSRGSHSAYLNQDSTLLRGLASIPACGDYLIRTFWPAGLIPDYPEPENLGIEKLFILLLAGIALTILALRVVGRFPWILVGWLWFLIVMFPTSGVFDLGRVYTADRYTYLPLIGIFLMICWSGQAFFEAASRPGRWLIGAGTVAAVLILAGISRTQLSHWVDSETLFEYTLTRNPASQIALTNLGQAKQEEGNLAEAARLYERLIEHHPGYHLGHYNLGTVRAEQSLHPEAEKHLRRASELNPEFLPALLDLSTALARQNRFSEARPVLEKALELDPSNEVVRGRLDQLRR